MVETLSDVDFNEPVVLSLYDYSANMVRPWAQSGYDTIVVDLKHDGVEIEEVGDGRVITVEANVQEWLPPRVEYRIVFAFPPCTNLAVSGARWFKDKGLSGLADGIELVEEARRIAEWADAPWMIENPVSTLSTYWRDPDYTFHPYEYDGFTEEDNAYSKKTCLWTSEDFTMPSVDEAEEYDERIHKMPPSEERSEKRSMTPQGFANAVYYANEDVSCVVNTIDEEVVVET
jgi:hypothetical protein